ncbi:23S rRNA (guanosine(2251)-2'-O)-methyltransferase RlmB [Mycoplasma leonicaptivi]|uniref:23S rRNA (guanosine(2251)-2'-O)-methyltransferase RlmB n=1 Tax=Mycoplasma leonicaptivi TaxID=36742 RepID=UPI0004871365|nr:23S rRNA (guanosine(2251)-2'-O)-methyltransferase RlmB [Mycoplasma leonicaptivi]
MKKLLMCGKNSVIDAIKNNLPAKKLYLSNKENIKHFKTTNCPIEVLTTQEMNKLTKENHQGFILEVNNIDYKDVNSLIKNKPKTIIVLDHIQDPHNLGAILRTINACGIKDVILPKEKSAEINSTVLKVSSGGFVGLNFYKVNSLSATLTKLKKTGYWVYATTLDSNAIPHTDVEYNSPSILIVGNEGVGVSKSVLSVCDQTVYIKQSGTVQSLNVSVATGIILFDYKYKNER